MASISPPPQKIIRHAKKLVNQEKNMNKNVPRNDRDERTSKDIKTPSTNVLHVFKKQRKT